MAYHNLASIAWGSSPNITGSIAYDYQRSGADMQYKVKITINTLPYSSSYFGFPIYATIKLDGAVKVNGHRIKAASPSVWDSALVYETGWLTVSGKSSGTTTLSVNIYSGNGESRDKTYDYSLYVVPAASSMTFSSFTMGNEGNIAVTRANKNYTDTITYELGNVSGTIATKSSLTGFIWTPPLDLAYQITNATSGSGTLRITTYNGNTKIGEKEYSFTVYVPAAIQPIAQLETNVVNTNAVINSWDVCVKGYSKLQYAVTASGAYGATIKSCQFNFADKTVSGLSGAVDMNNAGSFAPSVTVTDSRGRSITVTGEYVTVYEYSEPTIAQVSVQRCNANGVLQNEGTYVSVGGEFGVGASMGDHNAVTARCRYREINGSWSDYTVIGNGGSVIGGSILATKSYEAEITVTDSIGGTKTVSVVIPTAEVAFHLRDGGKGAAFGKYAESDALECAWDAAFDGDVSVAGALSVNGKPMDTGWIPLTLERGINEGTAELGQYGKGAAYRVVNGNHVYVAFNVSTNWSGSSVTVTTLPENVCPASFVYGFAPMNGRYIMRIYAKSDGNVRIEWVQALNASTQTNSATISWCNGLLDYFLI